MVPPSHFLPSFWKWCINFTKNVNCGLFPARNLWKCLITTRNSSDMQGCCCNIKISPLFSTPTLKVPEIVLERLRDTKNDKLLSCSLKFSEKKFPCFRYSEYFKKSYLQRRWCNITLSQKSEIKILKWKRFNNFGWFESRSENV